MKKSNYVISLFIIILSLFSLIFLGSCGNETNNTTNTNEEKFEYELSSSGDYYILSKYTPGNNYKHDVVIPATYNDLPVKEIGKNAFSNDRNLRNVSIPNSIIIIGDFAFSYTNLESVTIPDSVTTIGDSAFGSCGNLVSIKIPNSVINVGEYAFAYCSRIKEVILSDNLEEIKAGTFVNCTISTLVIGEKIKKFDSGAFSEVNNIYYNGTVEGWCNMQCESKYPSKNSNEKEPSFYNLMNKCSNFYIKDQNGQVIENDNKYSSLTDLVVPNGITKIYGYQFYGIRSIVDITLPNTLKTISAHAFERCEDINAIILPESIEEVGENAFNFDKIKKLIIPDKNITFGEDVFYGDNIEILYSPAKYIKKILATDTDSYFSNILKEVYITSGETIEQATFYNCRKLYKVEIADSVLSIENFAFLNCESIKDIIIPDSVISIGDDIFYGTGHSFNSIKISKNLEYIGNSNSFKADEATVPAIACSAASNSKNVIITGNGTVKSNSFKNSIIESVIIGSNITKVEENAFNGCSHLNKVTLLTDKIVSDAFKNCDSIIEVYNITSNSLEIGSTNLGGVASNALIIHDSTGEQSIIFENEDGIAYAYANNKCYVIGYYGEEKDLDLPYSFEFEYQNQKYNIDNYEIYKKAFYGCRSLININISDSVTAIGENAFYGCESLKTISLSNNLTSVDQSAFYLSTGGSSIDRDVYYNGTIENWCNIEFMNGSSNPMSFASRFYILNNDGNVEFNGNKYILLTNLIVPSTVTSIGKHQFCNFKFLTSVTIPNSVTTIEGDAFGYCYRLVEIYNLSNLELISGSTNNGRIGYYAKIIHTSLDEKSIIVTDDSGYVFAYAENDGYLIGYNENNPELQLPNSFVYDNKIIDSYEISDYALYYCTSVTSITIPNTITNIGNNVFYKYAKIKYNEFDNAYYLGNLENPYLCLIKGKTSQIDSCNIKDGCKFIYTDAFRLHLSLATITMPDSVISVGDYAFYACEKLKDFTLSNSLDKIGIGVFDTCSSLTGISIPDGVTSIGDSAFSGCSLLTSIIIPKSIEIIGKDAFYSCSKLTKVYYDGISPYTNMIKSINSGSYSLTSANWYYFTSNGASETETGNWWYYDNNNNIVELVI